MVASALSAPFSRASLFMPCLPSRPRARTFRNRGRTPSLPLQLPPNKIHKRFPLGVGHRPFNLFLLQKIESAFDLLDADAKFGGGAGEPVGIAIARVAPAGNARRSGERYEFALVGLYDLAEPLLLLDRHGVGNRYVIDRSAVRAEVDAELNAERAGLIAPGAP